MMSIVADDQNNLNGGIAQYHRLNPNRILASPLLSLRRWHRLASDRPLHARIIRTTALG